MGGRQRSGEDREGGARTWLTAHRPPFRSGNRRPGHDLLLRATRPSPAEVDAATAATQAAIDDPAASLANVEWAAEAEQATLAAWRHTPELDHARPEREPEIGA